MRITGRTKIMPIIGFPVGGVFSPPAINRFFEENGIDAVMYGMDLAPEAVEAFWSVMRGTENMAGCSITYPHKQAAFQAVDDMTTRAARLGALNTIRREPDGRLFGEATDGQAMIAAIARAGFDLQGRSAQIAGAGGGAGRAIADALCEAGIRSLVLRETDTERHKAVIASLREHWPNVELSEHADPCDILINATTLGKCGGDPLPFSEDEIGAATLCCDVITSPGDTQFVTAAKRRGAIVVDGNGMGFGQIEVQLQFLRLIGDTTE